MSDGMRRPPRIWEQKLESMIKGTRTGFGAASTSPVIGAPTPGPGGPGEDAVEPPVLDPPEGDAARKPANPSVSAAIGGLSILWTGLDSNGVPVPARSRVQVHVSTETGFTPADGTQRGLLAPGERLVLTDLTSGVTHFVRFVLVAPDGSIGEASDQVSAVAGFVLSTNIGTGTIEADMVSFDATAIGGIQQFVGTTAPPITGSGATQQPKNGSTWINTTEGSYYTLTAGAWVKRQWDSAAIAPSAITTLQIATGAITADSAIIASAAIGSANIIDGNITNAKIQSLSADKLTAGTIDASVITVNNLDADRITAGTLTGRTIVTNASGFRIRLRDEPTPGVPDSLEFLDGSTLVGKINADVLGGLVIAASKVQFFTLGGGSPNLENINEVLCSRVDSSTGVIGFTTGGRSFLVNASGEVFSRGIDNATTANAANVRIGGSQQLLKSTSTQRVKTDMIALDGELVGVDPNKISSELASVNPYDVLAVVPTEFESLADADDGQRILGFIAENVAETFPWAAEWDEEGLPSSVADRPILAALLAVVKDQQTTITDLTARIEALEA